jgi:uncharacterized coiled-coil DUF342 family protein
MPAKKKTELTQKLSELTEELGKVRRELIAKDAMLDELGNAPQRITKLQGELETARETIEQFRSRNDELAQEIDHVRDNAARLDAITNVSANPLFQVAANVMSGIALGSDPRMNQSKGAELARVAVDWAENIVNEVQKRTPTNED